MKRYWLRGGIVGFAVGLVVLLPAALYFLGVWNNILVKHNGSDAIIDSPPLLVSELVIYPSFLISALLFNIANYPEGKLVTLLPVVAMLVHLILSFGVGSLFGLAYEKLKRRRV